MKIVENPPREEWASLSERPRSTARAVDERVKQIMGEVARRGDEVLLELGRQYDDPQLAELRVSESELAAAASEVSDELKSAIAVAAANIEKYHRSQMSSSQKVETSAGVYCWSETRAIERVGLYIPGGSAPLFSTVLMLGIPARLAGCEEIVLCTPSDSSGGINPLILYTASQLGIRQVYKCGGAQAIAAMAYGSKSIPAVDKIFGPGNAYVTRAKQLVQMDGTAIDMPAGPSEVLVVANQRSNPSFVAADLLAQAEHGPDSQVILLCMSRGFAEAVLKEVARQGPSLPRWEIAQKALTNSRALVLRNLAEALDFSNIYAPEHLILAVEDAGQLLPLVENAGSVFLGPYTCESLGDYASGTNHTLPTAGFARSYSGVSVASFQKTISFQQTTASGLQTLGPAVELMARAEQLEAHRQAVSIRLEALAGEQQEVAADLKNEGDD